MTRLKLEALALAFAVTAGLATAGAAPALADARDCGSNHNIWHVHTRIGDVIEQVNGDRHDYGGHRGLAARDLIAARGELEAARADAIQRDGDNPACFVPAPPLNASSIEDPTYIQGASDRRIGADRRWVGHLIGQLSRDERDYAGHRIAAIRDLQAARAELALADRYAHDHGY